MKTNYSIEKETNICTRCGDSKSELIHHSDNQWWCNECEELYDEFILMLYNRDRDEDDMLSAMCY